MDQHVKKYFDYKMNNDLKIVFLRWVSEIKTMCEACFSSVQSQSCLALCPILGLQHSRPPYPSPTPGACSNSMSIDSVMPSSHRILCCPLLYLPSIFPSIRVFSNESILCIRWPKYLTFSFSISPLSVYSGLISFTMDWLNLLAVQGILKSLLQQHSSKASILSTQLSS